MIPLSVLVLAMHLEGWVIEIWQGDDHRYLPYTMKSEQDCREIAPLIEKHSNFQGWRARCAYVNGDFPKVQPK
jgi:hypothetical protein